ncbi:MAG TPA: hemolysin family protein, partial [Roseimicrobium sp.]|nr:hemolysin family protein [Roseimicrobium sp.]
MESSYIGDLLWGGFLVTLLVLLNGFFVAAEFAIVKIRDTQLQPLIKKGNKRAKVAEQIVKNLDAYLSASQLGITLASLGLGWFAEPIFAHLLDPVMTWAGVESESIRHSVSFTVGISAITFLHVVAGEQAPKSLAIRKPLPTTIWIALPLLWFYKLTYPFIWTLNTSATWLLRQVGIEAVSEAEMVHSEEELRLMFASSQKHAGGTALGREIVSNALDLKSRIAREVMRPRQEITVFNTDDTLAACIELAEKTRYSRFPLCEGGDLDKTLGVVHIKDLYALRSRQGTGRN